MPSALHTPLSPTRYTQTPCSPLRIHPVRERGAAFRLLISKYFQIGISFNIISIVGLEGEVGGDRKNSFVLNISFDVLSMEENKKREES